MIGEAAVCIFTEQVERQHFTFRGDGCGREELFARRAEVKNPDARMRASEHHHNFAPALPTPPQLRYHVLVKDKLCQHLRI